MDYEVEWADAAKQQFREALEYLEAHSASAAERLQGEINGKVRLLRSIPLLGSVYPPDGSGPCRKVVCGKYRIFYLVDEEQCVVRIISVWHSRRGDPKLPE